MHILSELQILLNIFSFYAYIMSIVR